jgi:hypothetical protein
MYKIPAVILCFVRLLHGRGVNCAMARSAVDQFAALLSGTFSALLPTLLTPGPDGPRAPRPLRPQRAGALGHFFDGAR